MEIEVHISSTEENVASFLTISDLNEEDKEVIITISSQDGGMKSIFILKEHLKRAAEIFTEKNT